MSVGPILERKTGITRRRVKREDVKRDKADPDHVSREFHRRKRPGQAPLKTKKPSAVARKVSFCFEAQVGAGPKTVDSLTTIAAGSIREPRAGRTKEEVTSSWSSSSSCSSWPTTFSLCSS